MMTPSIVVSLLLGLLILTIGCFLLRPCILYWRKRRQLKLYGITVEGQIIERWGERGARGQPWFYVKCRYSYAGQIYTSELAVWRMDAEKENIVVPVRCLPDNPEIASVYGDDFLRVEWVQKTFLAGIFMLIGAFILIGGSLGMFAAIGR